jgi:hypothetical protein
MDRYKISPVEAPSAASVAEARSTPNGEQPVARRRQAAGLR